MESAVNALFTQQLSAWELARTNYQALEGVLIKEVCVGRCRYLVQYNPSRMVSSAAKVDASSLQARPCFLCAKNRPSEQEALDFDGRYSLLVNPFPIFPRHLTLPDREHVEQEIASRIDDMLRLAKQLPSFTLFFNGAKCGASAPDHAHFQAGGRGMMPLEKEWQALIKEQWASYGKAQLLLLDDAPRATLVIESPCREDATTLFHALYRALPLWEGETEPRLNLLAYYEENRWVLLLFPRHLHRPACFFLPEGERVLCSPASVDLGGLFITPREEDFHRMDAHLIEQILSEVSLSPQQLEVVRERLQQELHKIEKV